MTPPNVVPRRTCGPAPQRAAAGERHAISSRRHTTDVTGTYGLCTAAIYRGHTVWRGAATQAGHQPAHAFAAPSGRPAWRRHKPQRPRPGTLVSAAN